MSKRFNVLHMRSNEEISFFQLTKCNETSFKTISFEDLRFLTQGILIYSFLINYGKLPDL